MSESRLGEIRTRHREQALERGISPRDVDLLLTDALQKPLAWIFSHEEAFVDSSELESLLARRYDGEPLQYIRGRTEFYSRDFHVDPRVLIPRPETELLVEAAVAKAPRGASVVDIGTGSGCVAISIERERRDLTVVGVDCSIGALAVAARNRVTHASRVQLIASDLLAGLGERFDVIVSNPPYIPLDEYEHLAREVKDYEPRIALTPGPKGTEVIERILAECRSSLAPGGAVIIEVGYGQENSMRAVAAANRYRVETFMPDLAGIPRAVVLSADAE